MLPFNDGSGPALFAGGSFRITADLSSWFIAKWQANCLQPPAAAAAPHDRPKNRYLSFAPNNSAVPVAFEVLKYGSSIGWVGEPDANGMARLLSTPPTPRAWTESVVHVGDCAIVPVGTYDIIATDGLLESVPLPVDTIDLPSGGKFWGDTVGSFNGVQWTAPNNIVNANDFLAALQKFQNLPQAPHVTVVDVQSVSSIDPCLNRIANIADVFILIQAFQGAAYPFPTNPVSCPPCP